MVDIITIDNRVQKRFKNERENLSKYKQELITVKNTLSLENLSLRVRKSLYRKDKELTQKIYDTENETYLNLYIAKTASLIQEYKRLLKIPIKMSFIGKPIKNDSKNKEVIKNYLNIVKSYYSDESCNEDVSEESKIICPDCDCTEFEIEGGNIYICINCFAQQTYSFSISSYNDVERVNVTSKYLYERKIHFRDCLKQYQGKQNCTIPPCVYTGLEEQFRLHHLLVGDKNTPKKKRFSKITKGHIMMFLKEPLCYTKQYENVHLIHYEMTSKKPPNLSHLETILLSDFDLLVEEYNKMNIDRKNFINTYHVLYQLLRRHKFPCKRSDFPELRTPDRKSFHDEICSDLFINLGFTYHHFF